MNWKKVYESFMKIGKSTGCHQMPERSFFIKKMQFPVCARCTGVFLGEVLGIIFFRVGEISIFIAMGMCGIMLLDWFIQFMNIYQSNNIRRLFTGLLCGYAFANFILKFLRWLSDVL